MSTDNTSQRRRVLYIAFRYPPDNNIAAIRSAKLAKYLPRFGWEPVVLTDGTACDSELPVEYGQQRIMRAEYRDPAELLLRSSSRSADAAGGGRAGLKRKLRNIGTGIVRKFRPVYELPVIRMLTKDPVLWYFPARKVGLSAVAADQDVALVFSTYSPSTAHFVASAISRRTRVPWVAEFRDLWSQSPYDMKLRPLDWLAGWVEKRTLAPARRLVTVSEPLAEDLGRYHGKNVHVIPSGFDPEDYSEPVPLTSKFTITYTGRLYRGRRDPSELFKALRQLKTEDESLVGNVEIRFVGFDARDVIGNLVEEYSLGDKVKFLPQVPFKQSVKLQKESTVLLLLSWNDPRDEGTYSGKLFEYLGARRPILATSVYEGGSIPKLLAETGSGVVANDAGAIGATLKVWLQEFRDGGAVHSFFNPKDEVLRAYTWEDQAKKLASVFDFALVE
ncbi:MAG: glycosyltransferase [Dehalococcoidia bacterium]|nr:glycosyltransferase [Dehalococcoidia bacterium]